jgi:hypothetical protein
LSSVSNTPLSLFTVAADTVDFNSLTSPQQAAIAGGADIYDGLGGNDLITLPNKANYNESVGTGKTLGWVDTPASPFQTGSQIGDTYTVNGGDGDYYIAEGAGTESITINGDGNSNITAGSGSDTISITGNGHSTLTAGTGSAAVSTNGTGDNQFDGDLTGSAAISGGGTLDITGALDGSATIGTNSTLELEGLASGGAIGFDPSGTGETLQIDATTMPTNVISGFASGDTIDLANIPYDSTGGATFFENDFANKTVLQIVGGGSAYSLQLDPTQTFSGGFELASDGFGGANIELSPFAVTGYSASASPDISAAQLNCKEGDPSCVH